MTILTHFDSKYKKTLCNISKYATENTVKKEVIRKIKYELTQSLVNWDVPASYDSSRR